MYACHAGPALDPRQLLPALVRFGEPGTAPSKREQVLKYVAFAMEQLRCTDRWVEAIAPIRPASMGMRFAKNPSCNGGMVAAQQQQ